ncbi:T9SS type A sorting domain-containing protein [Saprospiraceae bacterium]|nr:T9SS type A sorting domain-containing protein [Saprospiraceae bacterium]
MTKLIQILIITFIFLDCHSQSAWQYYSNDSRIQDIKVIGDNVWIGNPTALYILDIDSEKGDILQSINSELKGSSILEILPTEDYVWVAMEQGGIGRYTIPDEGEKGEWKQFYISINGYEDPLLIAKNLIATEDGTLWFHTTSIINNRRGLFSISSDTIYNHPMDGSFYNSHGHQKKFYTLGPELHYFDLETETSTQITTPLGHLLDWGLDTWGAKVLNDELYIHIKDNNINQLFRYTDSWHKIADVDEDFSLRNSIIGNNRILVPLESNFKDFISITSQNVEYFSLSDDLDSIFTMNGYPTKVIHEDNEGRFWLGGVNKVTRKSTVICIHNSSVRSYDIHHSFFSNYSFRQDELEKIDFDCDGNLIMLGDKTIQLFNPDTSKIIILPEFGNGRNSYYETVANDPVKCNFYVSQELESPDSSNILVFNDVDLIDTIKVDCNNIGDIHVTADGSLYATNNGKGVGVYDAEENKWEFNSQHKIGSARNIKESVNGILTFRTAISFVVFNGIEWITYDETNTPKINGRFLNAHLVDSKENLLYYYNDYFNDRGIYKFDGSDWEFYSFSNSSSISSIYEDKNGNYILGTLGSGLIFWDGIDYQEYNIQNSPIPSNLIYDIKLNPVTNDLWLIAPEGVIIFDPSELILSNSITESLDEAIQYSIFPNPSEGQFQIKPNFNTNYSFKVFNSEGRLELEQKNKNGILKFTINNSGLYFIQLNDGHSHQVSKIVVH